MEEKIRCESHLLLNEKEEISKGKRLQTDSFISICPETKSIRHCVRISNEFLLIIFQSITHPTNLCHITIRVANIVTFEKTI